LAWGDVRKPVLGRSRVWGEAFLLLETSREGVWTLKEGPFAPPAPAPATAEWALVLRPRCQWCELGPDRYCLFVSKLVGVGTVAGVMFPQPLSKMHYGKKAQTILA